MRQRRLLLSGAAASVALLLLFMFLQSHSGPALDTPSRYLWVSLVPVLVGLFAGGYITKFETPILKVSNDVTNLPEAKRDGDVPKEQEPSAGDWRTLRAEEYSRTSGLALAHEYRPSEREGQLFDTFIYLIRHTKNSATPPKTGFEEVHKAEFYLGEAWGHRVFTVEEASENMVGIRTHAYGTFLATCRITFLDPSRQPEVVHRYIDFEMATGQS